MTEWRRPLSESDTLTNPAWLWLAQALGMPALLATPPLALADITLPPPHVDAAPFVQLLGESRVRQDAEARVRHVGDVLKARVGDLSDAPELVLLPHNENDVLEILRLCVRDRLSACIFGAGRAGAKPSQICIDMTGMTRLMSVDLASGLAEVEAGITGDELQRQLAARGLMLDEDFGFGTLGGRLALAPADWLVDCRLATPRGIIPGGFPPAAGSRGTIGAITAATIRVQPHPVTPRACSFAFADFSTGMTALRDARDLGAFSAVLSDAVESDFQHNLRAMDEHPMLRLFMQTAAGAHVTMTFPTLRARMRYELIVRKLKGHRQPVFAPAHYRHLLLDRGVMVERWLLATRWSQLSARQAALRTALDRAMHEHTPRDGAHGLVLSQVRNPRAEGADLVMTAVYPRILNADIEQAAAIRAAGNAAVLEQTGALTRPASDIARAIKLVLDPNDVLPA